MLYRIVPLCLAVVACVALAGRADDKDVKKKADTGNTHEGLFVKADGDNGFTMTDLKGKEHKHTLADDATVTCDGKKCKLSDLKRNTRLKVTTKEGDKTMVVKVEARTRGPKFDEPASKTKEKPRDD